MAQQILTGRITDSLGHPLTYSLSVDATAIKQAIATKLLALSTAGDVVWLDSASVGSADSTALHFGVANELHKGTEATPAAADKFIIEDADNSWKKKVVLFSVLESTLNHDSLTGFVAAEHYRWDTDISSTATIHPNNVVDGSDASAIHDDTASEITAIAEKVSVADNDEFLMEDSADANAKKSIKWSNILKDVSMQDAYSKGATSAGRQTTITETSAPVYTYCANLDAAFLQYIYWESVGTLTNNGTAEIIYRTDRNHTGATALADDFVNLQVTRNNTMNNAGGSMASGGTIFLGTVTNTETAGAILDTTTVYWAQVPAQAGYTGNFVYFVQDADANPVMKIDKTGKISWGPGGAAAVDTSIARLDAGRLAVVGGLVVNAANSDLDTLFGTSVSDFALFIDGGNGRVGLSTTGPRNTLEVAGTMGSTFATIADGAGTYEDKNPGVSISKVRLNPSGEVTYGGWAENGGATPQHGTELELWNITTNPVHFIDRSTGSTFDFRFGGTVANQRFLTLGQYEGVRFIFDSSNGQWQHIGLSHALERIWLPTGSYTALPSDQAIWLSTAAGAAAITLPSVTNLRGRSFNCAKRTDDVNVLTLTADGADTWQGGLTSVDPWVVPGFTSINIRAGLTYWYAESSAWDNKNIRTITANDAADWWDCTILVDCTSNDVTVSLPIASDHTGKKYHIKKIDSTANRMIIDPYLTETIDGVATITVGEQWACYTVHCNGVGWFII